jgi:UDP-glucose:(heptosyl)LPS alpha-1,3-glucosyltransferase
MRTQELARVESSVLRCVSSFLSMVNPRYYWQLLLERRQIKGHGRAPLTIAVSEMVASDLRRSHPLRDGQVIVVRNGADCHHFSPSWCRDNREAARKVLGINGVCFALVANDFARKGVRQFIRATAIVAGVSPTVQSVVAGRSDPSPYLLLARKLGCEQNVRFLPLLKDPRVVYAAADVFVLPTWYDPCSLTLFEAMACGLPVITTRQNGASEVVRDGQEGYIIESAADVPNLARRMITLLNAEERTTMGMAARNLACKQSQERGFQRILDVMSQQLRDSGSQP